MLKDVQAQQDVRHIPLKHVGIKDLKWPLVLKDPKRGEQHSVAVVQLSVDLPKEQRGTHMSRFVECLKELGGVRPSDLEKFLDNLKEKLGARSAMVKLNFPYFVTKKAPVSGIESYLDVECHFRAEKGEKFVLDLGVDVPVHTLCPCSKEISKYGAHNQRAWARMTVRSQKPIWIEELVEMAEKGASSPLFSLLKRPDEKFVTEEAYENPRFVEDAVRDIALQLNADSRIDWYSVTVESQESIHNHNAFATVEKGEE
ncbi:GTP cyclohydrolase FolE2 [uncultured Acidaminococcus sp.]|uniref:GTP cyclohydrolase FolE2 n=1 Tax=uncultured Acidaminococcus sp. TaxID=352152 RepID=UPI002598A9B9|nr:GTP cyclohydrolase FolE2 [uncultured Acidaminococcus sp.]